ncbi:MAG: hypothetical protein K5901_04060 [Bacteroidales bacterium]|jgi:hypothetical protein|nr:hypothetical protein [Bacteroidales bacterium]
MKKVIAFVSAVLLLAAVSTSCSKGCHCYMTTDVAHLAPVFEDENMTKSECQAKQDELNEGSGMTLIKCK